MKSVRIFFLSIHCHYIASFFLGKRIILIFLFLLFVVYTSLKIRIWIYNRFEVYKEEIEKKNDYLNALLEENKWLLREIHHRVKNNLQIVMSLLNSQSNYLKDKAALLAIRDTQNRIYSMSLIHQKLYWSESVPSIDMNAYVHELIAYLLDNFESTNIVFIIEVEEIFLDVSQATTIALILNEGITNAIKHAFAGNKQATIKVSLIEINDTFELTVIDNGKGLPNEFDLQNVNTLGISIIKGLSEDIDGKLAIYNDKGTVVKLLFTAEEFNEIRNKEI